MQTEALFFSHNPSAPELPSHILQQSHSIGNALKFQLAKVVQKICSPFLPWACAKLSGSGPNPKPSSTGGISVLPMLQLQKVPWPSLLTQHLSGVPMSSKFATCQHCRLSGWGGRTELGWERGGAGDGTGGDLHCQILSPMSGHTVRHGGSCLCPGTIVGAEVRSSIARHFNLTTGKEDECPLLPQSLLRLLQNAAIAFGYRSQLRIGLPACLLG